MNLLPKVLPQKTDQERRAEFERSLIRRDAVMGGQIFGKPPKGHDRQFFCLDEHTWVWHEQWKDESGQKQSVTTYYNVRPSGIVKSQNGRGYTKVSNSEATNLHKAAKVYLERARDNYLPLLQTS